MEWPGLSFRNLRTEPIKTALRDLSAITGLIPRQTADLLFAPSTTAAKGVFSIGDLPRILDRVRTVRVVYDRFVSPLLSSFEAQSATTNLYSFTTRFLPQFVFPAKNFAEARDIWSFIPNGTRFLVQLEASTVVANSYERVNWRFDLDETESDLSLSSSLTGFHMVSADGSATGDISRHDSAHSERWDGNFSKLTIAFDCVIEKVADVLMDELNGISLGISNVWTYPEGKGTIGIEHTPSFFQEFSWSLRPLVPFSLLVATKIEQAMLRSSQTVSSVAITQVSDGWHLLG